MPLETTRALLLRKRESLLRRRAETLAGDAELLAEREPDPPDAAAELTAAQVLDELSEHERAELVKVINALERIEAGTYGHCINCKRAIPQQRLRALPEAERCAPCAKSCS